MKYSLLPFILVVIGCSTQKKTASTHSPDQLLINGKIWSSIFQQRAAEYKALCLQAFNIARLRVDEALQNPPSTLKMAIITDIDETFLDNSPYAVHQALAGKEYEAATWYEWTSKGTADTITGSPGFFNYAASKGIEIFYITNRDEQDKPGTLRNLQHFRFPFADNDHLIVRRATSSKESRRNEVARSHYIILLLGDNLADFSDMFDKKTEAERDRHVQSLASHFGKRFIVLPNFNYGGWEDAIYENSRSWTPAQKDSLLRSGLKSY
jgi:5'-nucleotidase (lipoprotein e(P4) family)